MEAQTTQVEYSTFANRPVLHCFPWGDAKRALIESDGKPYYNVFDFQPYFYCLESDPDPRGAAQIEPGFVGLDGAKLKKVVVGVPAEVPILRQQVHHREADVLFPLRYAIDRIPEIPHSPPDVLYADIEMASSKGVPDPLNPVDPITVISTYLKPQFVTFSWHPRFKQERLETGGSLLFRFTSERDLLAGYTAYVRKMWPDVWAGWNLINFDARCLYGRMLACGINPALLSPLGTAPGSRLPPFWITKDHEPVLKGTVLFDLLAAYKAFMNRDFDSLSLEATAQRELGTGKRPMDKSRMGDLWREDPERIEEYCRTDVELIVRLDRKLRLLEFFTEIHEVAGVFLGDIINWNLKKLHGAHIVETYIMRNSDRILRSHAHSGAMPELRGADPPEPTRGLFRNVIKIDDPSKYPSVMFTFNMGEDTLTDREQEPDCIRGELASFRRHEDQLGEIPRLIEQLFERKDHYHKLRNAENYGTDEWHRLDHRRYVFKQILNGFQGASSQPSSRIFHPAIANDITWAGREMFGIAYRTVSEMGYHVLGGHSP